MRGGVHAAHIGGWGYGGVATSPFKHQPFTLPCRLVASDDLTVHASVDQH